jgi:hypothetical protein
MKWTIDRINELGRRLGGWSHIDTYANHHRILDSMDRQAGIITRHKCAKVYTGCAIAYPQSEYVGARVRRLENYLNAKQTPCYFHLGAEG